MVPIQVLLVTKSEELKRNASILLIDHFGERLVLHRVDSLQEAIEQIEQKKLVPELVVIEQLNTSTAILNLLFALIPNTAAVLVVTDESLMDELKSLEQNARLVPGSKLMTELDVILKKFEVTGKIKSTVDPADFAAISADQMLKLQPLAVDVHLSLSAEKYVKIFRKGDVVTENDIAKYTGQTFYLKKSECGELLKAQADRIEALAAEEPLDATKAKKVADMSQDLVRSLISEVGFTEDAQRIAKSSVNMSLKLIGSKPRLSQILQDLKKKEGNFIASHSFLLGQISCGMAYSVGWNSASTYFKLSMAAFLHDIALNISTHEMEVTIEEAERSGKYEPGEIKILRFHPAKAAEYTRQFSEIPSDVEQIVAQHHERPDGTGYPRGMTSKYISPLGAVFIIAHDLILFMMRYPDAKVEKFYEFAERDYPQNPFRKILHALKTETKIA